MNLTVAMKLWTMLVFWVSTRGRSMQVRRLAMGFGKKGEFDFGGVVLGSLKQLTTQKWIYYVWQDNSPSRAETRLHLTPERFHGVNPVGTHHQDP